MEAEATCNPGLAASAGWNLPAADADEALVAAARRGCRSAFDRLVTRHYPHLYRIAFRLLGRREDAEDAVQDALLHCWRRLESFRGEARFASWLYRIGVNAAFEYARRQRRTSPAPDAPGQWLDPAAEVASRQERRKVREAIARLPDTQRLVVALYYYAEWSCDEIALALNLPPGTVRSHLFYSRRRLAARLGSLAEEER